MKKTVAWLMAALLMLSLAGCGEDTAQLQQQISDLTERVAVLEYRLEQYEGRPQEQTPTQQPVQQEAVSEQPAEQPEQPMEMPAEQPAEQPENSGVRKLYLENGTDWNFVFVYANETDGPLTFHSLTFVDNGTPDVIYADGAPDFFAEVAEHTGADFCKGLQPGEVMTWSDGHPGVDWLKTRTYIFSYLTEAGEQIDYTFSFELMNEPMPAADFTEDRGQDLLTLRHEADFCIEVAPEIYWVPVNALGKSRYGNDEVYAFFGESPEVKREAISTLYEAMQLYQVGGFAAADDNVRMRENGINWEHHKPGYYAVLTNEGCCATSANWLNYILDGDYEQVGYLSTSQRDGNGHIFNYIFHEGWYYIIDMTHYRTDWVATAVESGDMGDYRSTDFIAGNIHKTRDLQRYVDYVQNEYNDPPGLMFMYDAADCYALEGVPSRNGICITYEEGAQLNVLFDDPNDELTYGFAPAPKNRPNWE